MRGAWAAVGGRPLVGDPAMASLTVGHFIHSLELGGAQQVVRTLAGSERAGGIRHRVYAGGSGVFHDALVRAGTDVRVIPRLIPKFDPVWLWSLTRELRRDPVDIVHAHLFGDSLHGTIAAGWAGRPPIVLTIHNSIDDFTRLQRAGYAWMLPRAARVIACSESAGRTFRAFYGASAPAIEVIPNGIDPTVVAPASEETTARARAKLGIPRDALVVGAVGRLEPQKAFADLLTAFTRVAAELGGKARLVIVGSGSELDVLREQADALGIGAQLVLTGFRDDVRDLIPSFDVMAFSSLYEGLPVALLEAMACGVGVVATAVPGLVEVLSDRENALLVPARSPQALADALCYALRHPEVRHALARRAGELFRQRYTADRMVQHYEAVYSEVAARRAGGVNGR